MPEFSELRLPAAKLGTISLPRRLAAITEAVSWPRGTAEVPEWTRVWHAGQYSVCLGKPGKEASWSPPKTNANDMIPAIYRGATRLDYLPTFGALWREIETLSKAIGASSAELVASLLFRAAFMLDHTQVAPGVWRYTPPERVVAEIEGATPLVHTTAGEELPVRAFLHLIEALSLNEDVKYYTLGEAQALGRGKSRVQQGVGRRNNLLTCAHIVAVILGRRSVIDFGESMSRGRGVAPLLPPAARASFPLLGP